jgi:hypothetical protein
LISREYGTWIERERERERERDLEEAMRNIFCGISGVGVIGE